MKKRNNLSIVIVLFIILVVLIIAIPLSFSRYESKGDSTLKTSVAYYILAPSYQYVNVKMPDLVPRSDPYIYNFSIANNKDGQRTEVNLEYDLSIKTTTNLELEYELYLNENYQNSSAESIFLTSEIEADEDGTYFREMTTPKQYFTHDYNEINQYTLLIYFDEGHLHHDYQDVLESIFIIIDSRQIIN